MTLNNGASPLRQTMLPPGAFPAMELLNPISSGCPCAAELLTSVPSGRLCTANNSPLPGSALLIPCCSTQPLPALVDAGLRLGCPGLTLQDALAGVACRPTGTCTAKGGLGLGEGGEPAQMGTPPSAHGGRGQWQHHLCMPLNNGTLLL